ncbi:MAG TPA: glycosyltransferase family 39 protein [Candidatus Brocadiia bacterium]|nr:glycosyltransferase family 39 protein [Candidatus Brocadiia bacterium]
MIKPDYRRWAAPALLALCFAVPFMATMKSYGLTWDDAYLRAFWGERNLRFYLSGDGAYLDPARIMPCDFGPGRLDLRQSPMMSAWHMVLPASCSLAAACDNILRPFMSPIDGRHCLNLILIAGFAFFLFAYSQRGGLSRAAFFAILALMTHPRFWAHAHQNVKDVPEALFYFASLLCLVSLIETGKAGWSVGFALSWGLALGTKANAVTVPFVAGLALLPLSGSGLDEIRRKPARVIGLIALGLAGGALVALFFWPIAWQSPREAIAAHFRFLANHRAMNENQEWTWRPVAMAIATMPPVHLIALAIGAGYAGIVRGAWRRMDFRAAAICALMPLRTAAPGALHYDDIRIFLEFLPAACLLMGFGIDGLLKRIECGGAEKAQGMTADERGGGMKHAHAKARMGMSAMAALILAGPAIRQIAAYHPFELTYCNFLVGGAAGAARNHPDWTVQDYWCASYRLGCGWLRENVRDDAYLWTPVCWPIPAVTAGLELPPNIRVLEPAGVDDDSAIAEMIRRGADRDIYVMAVDRPNLALSSYPLCLERGEVVKTFSNHGLDHLIIRKISRAVPTDGEPAQEAVRRQSGKK